jgi:hypothetical protein
MFQDTRFQASHFFKSDTYGPRDQDENGIHLALLNMQRHFSVDILPDISTLGARNGYDFALFV